MEAQRDGNLVENLLEQAMVGGEATLSAATAKLARDKLKSAYDLHLRTQPLAWPYS